MFRVLAHRLPTNSVLDEFRRSCDNLYQRVRALFFLYAIHRFHLPERRAAIARAGGGDVLESAYECDADEEGQTERYVFCPKGYAALLERRFDQSIDYFLASVPTSSGTLSIDSRTEEARGEGSGDERTGTYASPRRTSLISNMDYCRSGSAATTSTDNSSYRRYSSLRSESSSAMDSDGGVYHPQSVAAGAEGPAAGSSSRHRIGPRYDPDESFLLPSDATSSALARGYRSLAFQTLADQVQDSVRGHPGNEWMFQTTSVGDHPLRFADELLSPSGGGGKLPTLLERTPVRMDISHSCWSDIFFLGMDFPEAARVINCSVDLAVVNRRDGVEHPTPTPPIECRLRLTTENPGTIRLRSVDLESEVLLTKVSQVFNYGADYPGLLKGGLVASGIVPSGLERCCDDEDDMPMCHRPEGGSPPRHFRWSVYHSRASSPRGPGEAARRNFGGGDDDEKAWLQEHWFKLKELIHLHFIVFLCPRLILRLGTLLIRGCSSVMENIRGCAIVRSYTFDIAPKLELATEL